jgi:type I restriction-modification system DNA methylase subunit
MFQKSVIDKYLKEMDKNLIKSSYERFKAVFCHAETIRNIEASKEEQYQEGFLIDLFVHSLGYTINPNPFFNLTTEYKNIADNRKADGAIIKDEKPIGVIELKGTDTVDLKKVEKQGFEYRYAHPTCKYVITSNFRELRLYVDTSESYEEFTLFNMEYADFERLYLLLSKNNIYDDKPLKIKNDSKLIEEDISDKLYKDYHRFKMNLFNSMVKNNPSINKVELLKKSQKLLDRILFIFFAEDRGLLPPNTISTIISENKEQANIGREEPLYNTYKIYFKHIDKGNNKLNISEYNGGLFASDELLDNLIIEDAVLKEDALTISSYDFSTDIDVNILGHIFENSLNDIDEMHAEVTGVEFNKSKTKRKKDGVFYTPSYITKYIVDNTIGVLCEGKKKELSLIDITLDTSKDYKRLSKDKQSLLDNLHKYREYISSLKILDPACGSGAFLNQALEYLIEEHRFIDLYRRPLEGDTLGIYDVRSSILENNLYGVDINEESIELARLSLWLRTAERGRKLNDLSKNIKCGNSLIDDESIAGALAFKWQENFPEIMANGGFDVVIGNPPYGDFFDNTSQEYLLKKYNQTFSGTIDIYIMFFQKSLELLSKNSLIGFITPHTFLDYPQYSGLRKYLFEKSTIQILIKLIDVFDDPIVDNAILIAKNNDKKQATFFGKNFKSKIYSLINDNLTEINYSNLTENKFSLEKESLVLNSKFDSQKKLKDFFIITQGITTGGNECFLLNENEIKKNNIERNLLKNLVKGENINKYSIHRHPSKILYITKKNTLSDTENSNAFRYLSHHKEKLSKKRETVEGTLPWYCIHWARTEGKFLEPKIIIRQTADRIIGALDTNNYYPLDSTHTINIIDGSIPKESYIPFLKFSLLQLNSKLFYFLYLKKINEIGKVYPQVKKIFIESLPFKNIPIPALTPYLTLCDRMLTLNETFTKKKVEFIDWITSEYGNIEISNKLDSFYEYEFDDLKLEIKKKLPKSKEFSPKDIGQLKKYFDDYKSDLFSLKEEIKETDSIIDDRVYELFDLTKEEIDIIKEVVE